MTSALLVLIVLAPGMALDVRAQPAGYAAIPERAARIAEHFAAWEGGPSYAAITARLHSGRDVGLALAHFDSLLAAPVGDMFWMYNSMAAYLYGRENLPESFRERYRDLWRTYTPYRGDTENHWVMYYASLYLAAQEWPGEPGSAWYNGRSSEENLRESEEWLDHWVGITTTIGQGEFDSPHYGTVFLAPMFMLYEFAEDERVRKTAQMMIDYLLADYAAEHLRGDFCGGHSRQLPQDVTNPKRTAMNSFGFLYFGEAAFYPRGETLIAALSGYELPEVIYHIAADRSSPYVHTETKRLRNAIRYSDAMNPPAYKYTYMAPDFCLGSLHGGILQPIQQHTWNVTFSSEEPFNNVFTLHPHYSQYELAMFFPEPVKIMIDGVVKSKGSYIEADKWVGGSPYEQTFQHENALIVLYEIPEGTPHPHVDGFFPKSAREIIHDDGGWIFVDGGSTYVAVYPIRPYEWIEEEDNFRLRSHHLRNGFVVEAVPASDHGSMDAFRKAVAGTGVRWNEQATDHTVTYTTTAGDVMRHTFEGGRFLNGEEVSLEDYRLFSGPFLDADVGSRRLRMTAAGITRELDFETLTISESRE